MKSFAGYLSIYDSKGYAPSLAFEPSWELAAGGELPKASRGTTTSSAGIDATATRSLRTGLLGTYTGD